MTPVAAKSGGKRAGARRGTRPKPSIRPKIVAYVAGITLLVVAWGYLVWAAIDFGSSARGGDSRAWAFLALAAVGAAACLFAGLMLGARLVRALGLVAPHLTSARPATAPQPSEAAISAPIPGPGARIASAPDQGPAPLRSHVAEIRTPPSDLGPRTGGSHRHRAG